MAKASVVLSDRALPTDDPREFRYVRAGALQIDDRKQREVDAEKIKRIANEWDWRRLETLTVCPRVGEPGRYDIVEGQHRGAAAIIFGGGDMMLPCMVLAPETTFKDQSQIALDIVKGRRGHSAYELWRLRENAGHSHEIFAATSLDKHGVRLGKATSAMTIGAVATISHIVHGGKFQPEFGAELLDGTLTVLMQAYPTYDHESSNSRWDRYMLLAVSGVLFQWPDVDYGRLIRSLRIRPAMQWVSAAKGTKAAPNLLIVSGITAEYNRNLRKGKLG